jgi:hypothetical protein
MNTFTYPIPTRKFLNNGGNIMKTPILLSDSTDAVSYAVVKRENNLLYLAIGERVHIDTCWVLANILVG